MRYARCKCGKAEAWTTDGFQDCQGCDDCGTTFASHPDHHKQKTEHDWEVRYSRTTGEPEKRECARCYKRAALTEGPATEREAQSQ